MGFVREHVLQVEPVTHGSVAAAELASYGLNPLEVLDFSVNTNPLGPAASVREAVQTTNWSRYPGDDELPLRCAIAERAGVTPEQVVLGNGSAELIWMIALACLAPGDAVGIVGPTFGEYLRAARVVGAAPRIFEGNPPPSTHLRALFVCNPNNPTAAYRAANEIERMLREAPDCLLILDEAYVSFVEERWRSEALLGHENLVILRSMTKDHAVPGLRLGYLISNAELANAVERLRPPWSVNAGALRAGLAAMQPAAEAHVERAREVVSTSRRLLSEGLNSLGFRVEASACNFVLLHVGNGGQFRRALLSHGVVVRDCASFGLPDCVRIACRLPDECERLLQAIARVITAR